MAFAVVVGGVWREHWEEGVFGGRVWPLTRSPPVSQQPYLPLYLDRGWGTVGRGVRHLLCRAVMAGAPRALWPCRKDGVAYRPVLTEQASRGHDRTGRALGRAIEVIEDKNRAKEGSAISFRAIQGIYPSLFPLAKMSPQLLELQISEDLRGLKMAQANS
ncbi:hypothetical protein C2845_PM17G03780 [Panicum miliaceum]|uniref:Uncharacterized protein n=1 Tax=Panicum miliaceum TaxID=4540 RepID=A0A3L6Q360_PANMI|nr:hypothetical protein C2845_PM17G03780 [Panicum miliaceum]